MVALRFAYCFTNLDFRPCVSPRTSCQTSTWPSQATPLPMPIVGMQAIADMRGDA